MAKRKPAPYRDALGRFAKRPSSAKKKARSNTSAKARKAARFVSNTAKAAPRSRRSRSRKTGTRPIYARKTKLRLDEVARAKLVLDDRLRKRTPLVETRWLTPTKAGFNAIDGITGELYAHAKRKKKGIDIYSFSVYVTFTGPDGKPVSARVEGIGIPIANRFRGLKAQAAFQESIRENIRRKIYNLLSDRFDIVSPGAHVKAGRLTEAQAKKMLKRIKEGRDARFKLIVYRQGV